MRRIILIALAMAGFAMSAQEQEYKFADHTLTMNQIVSEWHDQNFYTATFTESRHDIKDYFLSVAMAYPNEFFNRIVIKMLGYNSEGVVGNYVCDVANGYLRADLLTELDGQVQMCYWRCTDGGTLIAVAVQGEEYRPDIEDRLEYDDPVTKCYNDLMFFRINPDEAIWRPITPQQMCHKAFDFEQYRIELPQKGKNITLTHKSNPALNALLKWNGSTFQISKF